MAWFNEPIRPCMVLFGDDAEGVWEDLLARYASSIQAVAEITIPMPMASGADLEVAHYWAAWVAPPSPAPPFMVWFLHPALESSDEHYQRTGSSPRELRRIWRALERHGLLDRMQRIAWEPAELARMNPDLNWVDFLDAAWLRVVQRFDASTGPSRPE